MRPCSTFAPSPKAEIAITVADPKSKRNKWLAIGGTLLAVIVAPIIVQWTTDLTPVGTVVGWVRAFFRWLGVGHALPGWAILAGGAAGAFGVVRIAQDLLRERSRKRYARGWYCRDIIFGLQWEWGYYVNSPALAELTPLCPNCSGKLRGSASPPYASNPRTEYMCVNCEFQYAENLPEAFIKESVEDEIKRRLRTGEHKPAVDRYRKLNY